MLLPSYPSQDGYGQKGNEAKTFTWSEVKSYLEVLFWASISHVSLVIKSLNLYSKSWL